MEYRKRQRELEAATKYARGHLLATSKQLREYQLEHGESALAVTKRIARPRRDGARLVAGSLV